MVYCIISKGGEIVKYYLMNKNAEVGTFELRHGTFGDEFRFDPKCIVDGSSVSDFDKSFGFIAAAVRHNLL